MITILPDFREEGWHSMDLCADMLLKYYPAGSELRVSIPRYQRLLGFLPWKNTKNFDRWYNRWKVYPTHVRQFTKETGFFHIVDHSYAHLANYLPNGRVGIYCHDLDAFRCVLAPEQDPRPVWFRKMMGRVFEGFSKARVVFCNTRTTRENVLGLGLWKADEVVHSPLGVAEEFTSLGEKEPGDYLLHVGSCIGRKRIDVLLRAFSRVCEKIGGLKLIQAGGDFLGEQRRQIRELKLENKVEQRKNLTRDCLARLYRGAKCLMITSDAEGFGLPVIEALACGTGVVASDIPALREVGEGEVYYFPAGDHDACAEMVLRITQSQAQLRQDRPPRWSWSDHAMKIDQVYKSLES